MTAIPVAPLIPDERAPLARDFAESVAAAASKHPTADPWTPGAFVTDDNAPLAGALAELGWPDVGTDPDLLAFAGPAGVALGRAVAPLSAVDVLLGGALTVTGLSRYATEGGLLAHLRAGTVTLGRAGALTPVAYADAIGAAMVDGCAEVGEAEAAKARRGAWTAASVGYLAGLVVAAQELTLEHTKARVAFGRPLAALDTVQQQLATVATVGDGLLLLAGERPGESALAYAGTAACEALALCHQCSGAVGFTLDYPLQRLLRRTRTIRAWVEAGHEHDHETS